MMYLLLKLIIEVRRKTLIDTKCFTNAMQVNFYEKFREASPISFSELQQASV